MRSKKTASVICFGEVLWDVFPKGRKPGGAPLNVAYHLNRLGINSKIISRVGRDELGTNLLELMDRWEIPSTMCQVDKQYATGKVMPKMDRNYDMTYEILFPVAWDYIQWDDRHASEVKQADALVFGSLIMRNEVSCQTLLQLLPLAKYRVFDVNLREPFYSADMVLNILEKTELLKLNQYELDVICSWISPDVKKETDKIDLLRNNYQIAEILLTRGSQGASYYTGGKKYDSAAYEVDVADTVGSGDAFLAAFLARKLAGGTTIDRQLSFASALGAFVASSHGACPEYSPADLQQFEDKYPFKNIERKVNT